MDLIRWRCWSCGNSLEIAEDITVATCDCCGNTYTIPKANNEKKMHLFARANRLLASCEFDKAENIYETIVAEFPDEAEAYWCLVMCKYGIEYVDDPAGDYKVPTCHRASFESLLEDANYKKVLVNADPVARQVYQEKAEAFEQLRQDIMKVSASEKPYDIFISFKDKDENGNRTLDSALAQELYVALTNKGYRVFFSRITLRDYASVQFEPYIFAALNSAKVMLVVGTCYEYLTSVWVKNEWNRFLKLMSTDKNKYLYTCYKDMDPEEDMPKEFKARQHIDLNQIGAIDDLIFNLEKYVFPKQPSQPQPAAAPQPTPASAVAPLLERAYMFLEDAQWDRADEYLEKVLDQDPKNARAYLGKLLVQRRWKKPEWLQNAVEPFEREEFYQKAMRFADPTLQATLQGYLDAVIERYYAKALDTLATSKDHRALLNAGEQFKRLGEYKDSVKQRAACIARAKQLVNEAVFHEAAQVLRNSQDPDKLLKAADQLRSVSAEFPDAVRLAEECKKQATYFRQSAVYERAIKMAAEGCPGPIERAIEMMREIRGFKDADQLLNKYEERLEKYHKSSTYYHAQNYIRDAERCLDKINPPDNEDRENAARYYRYALRELNSIPGYSDADQLARRVEKKARRLENRKKRIAIWLLSILAIIALSVTGKMLWDKYVQPVKEYERAMALYEKGEYTDAMFTFGAIADHKDARQRSLELWDSVRPHRTIDACYLSTAHIKNDGTVRISGRGDQAFFSDVVHVAHGSEICYGLKEDGTVVTTDPESEAAKWKDIVDIDANTEWVAGLQLDGTVIVAGDYDGSQPGMKRIVAIAVSNNEIVGLTAEGTVEVEAEYNSPRFDVSQWTDMVAVTAGSDFAAGLKADGTVWITGEWDDTYGTSPLTWTNIVQICGAGNNLLGLKSDGTVVFCGKGYDGSLNIEGWTDIVAIAGHSRQSIGLKSDGTVIAVGAKHFDNYDEVHDWTDIRVPAQPKKEETEQ